VHYSASGVIHVPELLHFGNNDPTLSLWASSPDLVVGTTETLNVNFNMGSRVNSLENGGEIPLEQR
jgi:hypothetical protein